MIEAFARLIASRPDIRGGGFRAIFTRPPVALRCGCWPGGGRGRRFRWTSLAEEPEGRELVEQAVQAAESGRILRACMTELRPDYREALFLVYFEGLSHAEAAAVMGKREKQVADLVYRGKNALRKRLEQERIGHAHE